MAHEHASFWGHIRRRIVVTSTMERDVRLTFMLGSSIIPIAVMLSIFHWALGPPVHTLVGEVPMLIVVALALGELLVFFFLFAGLMRLKSKLRYSALFGLFLMLFVLLLINAALASGVWLMLPLVALLSLSVVADRWKWSARRIAWAGAVLAASAIILASVYVAAGQQDIVISALGMQGLLAMLGLFMASTDIAEIVSFASEWVVETGAGLFASKFWGLMLAVSLVLLNIAANTQLTGRSTEIVAQSLGVGLAVALWLGLIYWLITGLGRRLGALAPHIGYKSMLLVVSIFFVTFQSSMLWRLLRDPVSYRPKDAFTYTEFGTLGLLALLAFLTLFLLLGRRSEQRFLPLAYGVCIGLFWFMYYSSGGRDIVLVADAVAMGSLVFLLVGAAVRSVRKRFDTVCQLIAALNLSFVGYSILFLLFMPKPGTEPGFGVWQAVVVLAALAWDIAFSGEGITNRHTISFPRISRVCFFLAYIVSVALFVMISESSQLISPVTGEISHGVFESEPLVAVGLALFGAPFFFFIFAVQMRGVLISARPVVGPPSEPQAE